MPVEFFDIELEEGADYDDTVTWGADGSPVDLTGAAGSTRVSATYGGSAIVTITNTLGGTAGTIRTQFSKAQAATIADAIEAAGLTEAKYQTEITFSDTTTERFRQGAVTVEPRA
jgi:hypothetical protein